MLSGKCSYTLSTVMMKPFDVQTIARLAGWLAQQDDFVFLESARVNKEDYLSLLFRQPCNRLVCRSDGDAADFLAEVDRVRRQGYFLAGWLSYEFGYLLEPRLHSFLAGKNNDPETPLAVLGVYTDPLVYDHRTACWSRKPDWPAAVSRQETFCCTDLQPTLSRSRYLESLKRIQEYIRAGDTYQVNFTLHLDFFLQGSIASLYQALRRNQSVAYGAWIRHEGRDILSFSPELFFAADLKKVRVRPMKGTMARGRTTSEDAEHRRQLQADPKNRCENVMIVDLLRNDLARLLYMAGGGTVAPRSLFDVETYESLLQMTSTIEGRLSEDAWLSFQELAAALFPCGSVTGAPKIRTMEIIHELEYRPRGVYCGAIGYIGPEKWCFNVPIRTLELSGGKGRMGIGSGIVADSDPESEWRECLLKGNFLTKNEPDFQLIETLLLQQDGNYFLLDFHLERLADSARYFSFACDIDEIRSCLQDRAAQCSGRHRVRLLLYRDGRSEVGIFSLDDNSDRNEQRLAVFSRKRVDPDSPYRFHKTTRRKIFDRERNLYTHQGYYEVLFVNTVGLVTEGAVSNLFIRQNGRLVTPPVSCGLLAGTYRRMLLEKGRAEEQILSVQDVLAARKVYVANSVRGLVRIKVEG